MARTASNFIVVGLSVRAMAEKQALAPQLNINGNPLYPLWPFLCLYIYVGYLVSAEITVYVLHANCGVYVPPTNFFSGQIGRGGHQLESTRALMSSSGEMHWLT